MTRKDYRYIDGNTEFCTDTPMTNDEFFRYCTRPALKQSNWKLNLLSAALTAAVLLWTAGLCFYVTMVD